MGRWGVRKREEGGLVRVRGKKGVRGGDIK